MKFKETWERNTKALKFLVAAGVVALTPGLAKAQERGDGTYKKPYTHRLPGGQDPVVAQLNRQTPESIQKAKLEMEATIKAKRAKQRARITRLEELEKFDQETEALLLAIRTNITDPSLIVRERGEAKTEGSNAQ